jgi:hypothetical protein
MPGRVPGVVAETALGHGRIKAKMESIGAGNAGEPGTQSSTLRIIGK